MTLSEFPGRTDPLERYRSEWGRTELVQPTEQYLPHMSTAGVRTLSSETSAEPFHVDYYWIVDWREMKTVTYFCLRNNYWRKRKVGDTKF